MADEQEILEILSSFADEINKIAPPETIGNSNVVEIAKGCVDLGIVYSPDL